MMFIGGLLGLVIEAILRLTGAGTRLLTPKIPSTALQRIFSVACVIVAAMMLMRNAG